MSVCEPRQSSFSALLCDWLLALLCDWLFSRPCDWLVARPWDWLILAIFSSSSDEASLLSSSIVSPSHLSIKAWKYKIWIRQQGCAGYRYWFARDPAGFCLEVNCKDLHVEMGTHFFSWWFRLFKMISCASHYLNFENFIFAIALFADLTWPTISSRIFTPASAGCQPVCVKGGALAELSGFGVGKTNG